MQHSLCCCLFQIRARQVALLDTSGCSLLTLSWTACAFTSIKTGKWLLADPNEEQEAKRRRLGGYLRNWHMSPGSLDFGSGTEADNGLKEIMEAMMALLEKWIPDHSQRCTAMYIVVSSELADLVIQPFTYEKYATEDLGTPDFVAYHQKQLQLLGVTFGQGGFKVMDLHGEKKYQLQHGNVLYKGGVDAGVVPYTKGQASALQLLRTLFQHRQSTAAKQAYRDSHPELVGKDAKDPGSLQSGSGRPQAICALLAAHVVTQVPMLADLTDGTVHHLLLMNGGELITYSSCRPLQAYYKIAQWLNSLGSWAVQRTLLKEPPSELSEDVKRWVTKITSALVPEQESLRDHVNDVRFFHGPEAAFEFALGALSSGASEMSESVRQMYGWWVEAPGASKVWPAVSNKPRPLLRAIVHKWRIITGLQRNEMLLLLETFFNAVREAASRAGCLWRHVMIRVAILRKGTKGISKAARA
ncbi:hypothetical protein WJX74_004024 [Apatococcus lobatus]|uniref:Uncharacterized protein n=1 Tax=Apatococcus lobatus TaxID=904363 RepID=A0AAW1QTS8_9CHLO